MIWDVNFFGLFVNAGLAAAVVSALLMWPVRRILAAVRVYEWVWHPALVDLAIFFVVWAGVASALQLLGERLPSLTLLIG
jgi:hypothetical protein